MPTLEPNTLLLMGMIGLLLIVTVLLIALLSMNRKRKQETAYWFREMADAMEDGMRGLGNELEQQGLSQREAMLRTLQAVNDSLMNTLSSTFQQQSHQLGTLLQQSFDSNQSQEIRLERMRQTLEGGMQRLQTENAQKLEEMRKTVDDKLHETLDKRLGESFAQVSQRLEHVYKSLGEMQSLATGVGDLKRMLSNVKARGIWGEMQLGALLEQALTSSQYAQNVAVKPGSEERVEFAVCLPGNDPQVDTPVYLPLDSKFPQEDYVRLAEASQQGDSHGVDAAQKALLASVRVQAKRISSKYIAPPHTTDFAVMFLPIEALYAEVMRHAEVVEQLQRELRVVMAGPSTLLALLNSLQMGFRTLAIQQRSTEVWQLLGTVKTDFSSFAQVLQKTQEKLQQATASIDTAFARTRSIERKLRQVEVLDGQAALLPQHEPEEKC